MTTTVAMNRTHPDPIDGIRAALNRVLRGKAEVVEHVLACLLARGHLLVEDLPGLGKTTLAKALAQALGGKFARVQCTPDLLPGDITGFRIFDQNTREFEFMPGPVFADVLLADEINRTTPRTQSALLEAMAERQVTVDNVRHVLVGHVLRDRHPEPGRAAWDLPLARSAARSVRDEAADRLPGARSRAGHARGGGRPGPNGDQSVAGRDESG